MKRRSLISAAAALLAAARAPAQGTVAAPAGHRYVVVSLVSDKLSFFEKVGGTSDPIKNRPRLHEVPLPGAPYDTNVLQAIAAVLPDVDHGARMSFLAGSSPDFYADQEAWFDGDGVTLPEKLRKAVVGEQADFLLLLTKWRGEAAIQDGQATVGSGKIDGLGFYLFARREGQSLDDTVVHNYIAPFVYARLSLIDVATFRTVRSQVIQAGRSYPALTPQEQIDKLVDLLGASTQAAVPRTVRAG